MKTNSWLLAASCCFSAASAAFGPPPPSRPDGKPAKMEDFSWSDPFATQRMKKLTPICAVEKTFEAKEYLLDDLQDKPPKGLRPWQEGLKKIFKGRDYPGSWDGIDPHGYDRNLLLMEYSQVPIKVREWIEEQERSDGDGKGLFAVYEKPKDDKQSIQNVVRFPGAEMAAGLRPLDQKKIVIFAPGALYGILPLWAAEASDCKGKNYLLLGRHHYRPLYLPPILSPFLPFLFFDLSAFFGV